MEMAKIKTELEELYEKAKENKKMGLAIEILDRLRVIELEQKPKS